MYDVYEEDNFPNCCLVLVADENNILNFKALPTKRLSCSSNLYKMFNFLKHTTIHTITKRTHSMYLNFILKKNTNTHPLEILNQTPNVKLNES